MDDSPNEQTQPPNIAPTLQLSRRGLVFSLLAMVIAGLLVYQSFPPAVGGPDLPVAVSLDKRPVDTTGSQGAVVTEVVVITNEADHEIGRLAIEINGQYLMFTETPLEVETDLVMPLRVFTDKRSSQRYDPSKYPPEEIIVRGQLPNGARGSSKFEFGEH